MAGRTLAASPRATRSWRIAALAVALAWSVGVFAAPPAHAVCFTDVQGADDEPGQKDLDEFCLVGTCGGSNVRITWNFDDTNWTGNNTGDACALFDTNGDGNVDRAVCVTIVDGAMMQAGNPKCYTCGNTRPDRCTSSVLVACTSTCSVVGNAVDPFAGDPNHTANDCKGTNCVTLDAQANCCLTPGDAGTGGVLIDVCSYPSQQPNSDPSDCVVNRTCSVNNPNDPACDDNNPCTVDSCDTTFGVCRHVAGNQGTQCRAPAGVCDVPEVCDGTSIFCPADQFAQGGVCRNASDVCDVAESCSGTSPDCPADGVKPQGTLCRASAGQCDVQEVCDGSSKACPPDGFQPNNTPCNDNNACTTGDVCLGGTCTGGPPPNCNDNNVCTDDSCNPQTGCVHTNNTDPCNDNNACTTADACSGGSCVGGPPPDCNDNDVCTDDGCNPASGCTHTNNTAPCDDGDACTSGDQCSGGSCQGGSPTNCNDGNTCTTDSCASSTGCVHTPLPNCCNFDSQCADTDQCTQNEHCVNHTCVSDPVICNDNNVCTDDTCNPATGCAFTNNNDPCDDSNACTTNDACSGGACVGGPPPNCNDNDVCTDDGCNPASGCTHTNNTAPCDDGSVCTTNDTCQNDVCVGGPPPNCNDNNVCTDDSCNPTTPGGCVHTDNSAPCDDGNGCSVGDICSGGVCTSGGPKDCNDQNPCTDDSCSAPSGICQHLNNADPCSDGNGCTLDDFCFGGTCQAGTPKSCNDDNLCTDDSCDAPSGNCLNVPNSDGCDDGNACTTTDTCSGGACVPGPPANCDDGNVCTNDGCDPATGCTHVNNNDPCNDNDACTTADACSGGTCVGGPPPDCNDNNVCTDDGCNPASGCTHTNNSAACSDDNNCTINDTCSGGTCVGGPPPDCDDQNVCTTDSCEAPAGCHHTPVSNCCNVDSQCADTDQCTTNERCVNHACVSDPVDCNDNNVCTDDGCNPATGCTHVNNNDPCNDNDACTTNDACSGGTCVGGPPPDCNDNNVCTTDGCEPATGCTHTNSNPTGSEAGHCGDMIDNDCDGLIDCADPDCLPPVCSGGPHSGEDCSTCGSAKRPPSARACTHTGGTCQCGPLCKDPTTVKFGPPGAGLDQLKSHGRASLPISADVMGAEVAWLLTNANGMIYRAALPPGALTAYPSGDRFAYKNPDAKIHGGIYKVLIKISSFGESYGYRIEAYGDMSRATDDFMSLQFYIANQPTPTIHTEVWKRTKSGWVAHGFSL